MGTNGVMESISMASMTVEHMVRAYRVSKRNVDKLLREADRRGIDLNDLVKPKKERKTEKCFEQT